MIFAALVYGLFTANLLLLALVTLTVFLPREFVWLVDLSEALELMPEVQARLHRDKLEAIQLLALTAVAASTSVALFLAYLVRGAAKGSTVESHAGSANGSPSRRRGR